MGVDILESDLIHTPVTLAVGFVDCESVLVPRELVDMVALQNQQAGFLEAQKGNPK
ncbi:hypothetical protein AcW1_008461 [Taiwanofungus camphoratus]|nr:hypothetical protein AcW1_008461 [Antrodia cinnamomea]